MFGRSATKELTLGNVIETNSETDDEFFARFTKVNVATPYIHRLQLLLKEAQAQQKVRAPKAHVALVRTQLRQVAFALKAIELGFEPCTPPARWYCGVVQWGGSLPANAGTITEEFPCKNEAEFTWGKRVWTFRGLVPATVVPKWEIAVKHFGDQNIRVYSPHRSDFEVKRAFVDPIMIGGIMIEGELHFFRIAYWDTARDLEALDSPTVTVSHHAAEPKPNLIGRVIEAILS